MFRNYDAHQLRSIVTEHANDRDDWQSNNCFFGNQNSSRHIATWQKGLIHYLVVLPHWSRDKLTAVFQMTFSCVSFFIKMYELRLKFYFKFVSKGQISNIPALVQIMTWCGPGDKPLSESMMVNLLTHIWVTRPQLINNRCAVPLRNMYYINRPLIYLTYVTWGQSAVL